MNIIEYIIYPFKVGYKDWKHLFNPISNYKTNGFWININTCWKWNFGDDYLDFFFIKNKGKCPYNILRHKTKRKLTSLPK